MWRKWVNRTSSVSIFHAFFLPTIMNTFLLRWKKPQGISAGKKRCQLQIEAIRNEFPALAMSFHLLRQIVERIKKLIRRWSFSVGPDVMSVEIAQEAIWFLLQKNLRKTMMVVAVFLCDWHSYTQAHSSASNAVSSNSQSSR